MFKGLSWFELYVQLFGEVELLVEVVLLEEVVVLPNGRVVQCQASSRCADSCDSDRKGDSVVVNELLRGGNGALDTVHCLSFRSGISHYIACSFCDKKNAHFFGKASVSFNTAFKPLSGIFTHLLIFKCRIVAPVRSFLETFSRFFPGGIFWQKFYAL